MRHFTLPLLVLAAVSATAVSSYAQQADPATPAPANYLQAQPAPIEHAWDTPTGPSTAPAPPMRGRRFNTAPAPRVTESQPAQGIYLRAAPQAAVETVAKGADRTELRVEHGIVNVNVHHPAANSQILVDLPGGQTALLKDGFYTFNAETNTVRVLKGEAHAFPGNKPDSKGVKVKEDHAVAFTGPDARATEFVPEQARADVLPSDHRGGEYGTGPYSDRPHGDGFYGEPYGWGYPSYGWGPGWGYWGDPFWGYGYPFGFGFGYYGGFGYRGGFHGRFR